MTKFLSMIQISKITFVLLFTIAFHAQTRNFDSELQKHPKQDSVRVEILIDYCVESLFSNPKNYLSRAKEAYQISQKNKYTKGIIRSLNCIGNYHEQKSNADQAFVYYFQALQIAEKNKDIDNQFIGFNNIGIMFNSINQPKKALQYLLQGENLMAQNKQYNTTKNASLLTNIAISYSQLQNTKKSLDYFQKVLTICKFLKLDFGIALATSNIGQIYIDEKNYPEAEKYLLQSKAIAEKLHLVKFLGNIYRNIAILESEKQNKDKAKIYYEKSLSIAKETNDKSALIITYGELEKLYYAKKDFKNAYESNKQLIVLKDSIFNTEKQSIIEELNTKYETQKKEEKIKSLSQEKKIAELENQKQKSLLFIIISSVITLSILVLLLFRKYQNNKEKQLLQSNLDKIKAEKKAVESDLKALKSQMNPHFIFNSLHSIQTQFLYGDKNIANEMMTNFTQLTRDIMETSNQKWITIEEEINILKRYLELEKMRIKDNFFYTITHDTTLELDYHKIPPMLLQPFVENSIKHGLMHKEGKKIVSIHFSLDAKEEHIVCTIEDNGIGREKSAAIQAQNKHKSFSTNSIQKSLQLLNNSGNEKDILHYEDLKDTHGNSIGTKVTITISL